MKMRVEYINRPHKNKIYSYPFLVSSYRNKNGKPAKKIILNLSKLPEHAVEALRFSLQSDEKDGNFKVAKNTIEYINSMPFGATWAV